MRAGSLKTLGIGRLFKPDQVVQVLEELPHCTHLSELELALDLSLSDEVGDKCCGLDMHAVFLEECCVGHANTRHTLTNAAIRDYCTL